jgi:hypothetical protein
MSNTFSSNIVEHLQNFIGETVTIYTTSGGQSGCGFTGVILYVNPCIVRLVTSIGPAPGCAVGSSCGRPRGAYFGMNDWRGGNCPGPVGSACDIPIDKIACFVHNTV